MVEIIGLVIGFLTLFGGLIAIYVNMNLKIKEIDIRLKSVEDRLGVFMQERRDLILSLERINDKMWQKLDSIETKIDAKFEDLAVIKAEHEKYACKYNSAI